MPCTICKLRLCWTSSRYALQGSTISHEDYIFPPSPCCAWLAPLGATALHEHPASSKNNMLQGGLGMPWMMSGPLLC